MSKPVTRHALVFFCWTLETLYMYRITTFLTSLLVRVKMLGIKTFLVVAVVLRYRLSVTCIILVTGWSRFHKRLLLLVFACWKICVKYIMQHSFMEKIVFISFNSNPSFISALDLFLISHSVNISFL